MMTFYPEDHLKIPTVKLVVIVDGKDIGHFVLIPHSEWMYEVHTSPFNRKYFRYVAKISRLALEYFFNHNKKVMKLITYVPVYNRLAAKLSKDAGMTLEGLVTKSYLSDGQMVDQELYGISREEVKCQ